MQSVLLRAEVLSGEPTALIEGVTELGEGDFPIQLGYDATYGAAPSQAPSAVTAQAPTGATGATAAAAPGSVGAAAAPTRRAPAVDIYAGASAAVVAAQDGTIVAIGHNRKLGRYVKLRNAFGDVLTYGNLAAVSHWFTWPKHDALSTRTLLSASLPQALAPGPRPGSAAATAGSQRAGRSSTGKLFGQARGTAKRSAAGATAASAAATPVVVTLNLRSRSESLHAVATLDAAQRSTAPTRARHHRTVAPPLARYFTAAIGLRPQRARARPPARRVARARRDDPRPPRELARATRPHLIFELQPAGSPAPINPRPFLDAWSQLETLALHRRGFTASLYGPDSHLSTRRRDAASRARSTSPASCCRTGA